MKKILSISLIAAVFLASMSEAAIYLAFKANQSVIVQNFCINQNAPEKKCHGKCFLKDRLAENEGDQNTSTPSSIFELSVKINFFPTDFLSIIDIDGNASVVDNFATQHWLAQSFFTSFLRPPQVV